MNPSIGWALAAAALFAGWQGYGWQGLVFAVTLIVFWLVLQFNRALRVMKNAASAPVGHVPSAVMLHSRLQPRLTLMQVVALTRSLGRKLSAEPETWAWSDAGGATVTLIFGRGKLERWSLSRAEPGGAPDRLLESAD
jgi:phosphatidylglycerophosphate synthase